MSKEVDRSQVLKSIKVTKAVKKDGSWIHKANPGKKEQDKARADVAKDNGSSPVKKKSYVLSAVKKFESADCPLQKKEYPGTTVEEASIVLVHVSKSPPPSAVKATVKSKARVPAEDGEVQPEIAVASTAEENNGRYANICVEGHIQSGDDAESVCLSKGNPEAREENKEEYPDTTVEGSNVDHTAAKVSSIPDMMASTGLSQSPTGSHAVPEDVVKSLPETPAANKANPGDEEVPQGAAKVKSEGSAVETTGDTKNISLLVLSAIMKFKDVDESAAPTEEVSKTTSEEAVECEVQLVNNSITEQSAESVPTNAEDLVRELNINDALETVNDLEAKAVQGKYSDRGVKLTDALDVQPPTADTVPEPVEEPEQSQSEQAHINQSDDAQIDVKAVCSFCDRVIDGKTKLIISEPALTCHPECLKCNVCAKTLGDLLTRMFLHHQVIHCDDCFASALVA